jgi:hypothetical protein
MDEQEDPGCYFHGYEPIPEKYYILCLECGHCYHTAEELLNTFNDIMYEGWFNWEQGERPWIPATDVNRIHFCALCAHDF